MQQQEGANLSPSRGVATALICAAMIAIFAALAWTAVRGKSITYDEVLHTPAAYQQLHSLDFRLNPEHPPLWKYLAALSQPPMKLDAARPLLDRVTNNDGTQWAWARKVMFSDNDGQAAAQRSRAMMLLLGIGLAALVGWWGWKIKGAVTAIVAAGLVCFDPNFLAHAPLVTNDVAFTFAATAVAFAVWRVGQRATLLRVIGLLLTIAIAVNVKFSGVLLGPILAGLLLLRAILGGDWRWFGREIQSVGGRIGIVAVFGVAAMLVTYGGIWASYGFRFAPSADGNSFLPTRLFAQGDPHYIYPGPAAALQTREFARVPSTADSGIARTLLFCEDHHLFPQAWTAGVMYTYANSQWRYGFLKGRLRIMGWWYYFPLAMLFKEPVGTLLGIFTLGIVALERLAKRVGSIRRQRWNDATWTALCLLAPVAGYGIALLRSHLDIGYRHALPLLPFMFLGIGWISGIAWKKRWGRGVVAILGLLLVAESAFAWPNYIAFFNLPSGSAAGGIRLLGDSNLDWGQDLILLAKWQKAHPQKHLYLEYFGEADPKFYGIAASDYKGEPLQPGDVLAISATRVQTDLCNATPDDDASAALSTLTPDQILGGSIYLFFGDERTHAVVGGHSAAQ